MLKRVALILPFLLALQSFKVAATVAFFLSPSAQSTGLHSEKFQQEAFAFNAPVSAVEELSFFEELTEEEEDELEGSSCIPYPTVLAERAYAQGKLSASIQLQCRKLFILYNSRKVDCDENVFRG